MAAALGVCFAEGCTNPPAHRGWCVEHHPRCSVEGCGAFVHSRGLCNRHYLKWYDGGNRADVVPPLPKKRGHQIKQCSVEGCGRNSLARGMCTKHYRDFMRKRV